MTPLFIATRPFDPSDGERWGKYVAWSGLRQLEEVVSLDSLLCPTVLPEIKDSYWSHILNEDFMLGFFTDLDFLKTEIASIERRNLLCVLRNPIGVPAALDAPSEFKFVGFDLLDPMSFVSALTNCGGFDGAFRSDELSTKGLLTELARAIEVQGALRRMYPNEAHAKCDVYAILRSDG